MALTEDDLYRRSTQYRLWSYTIEQLSSMRLQTNALAAERVKIAIKSVRQAQVVAKETIDQDGKKNDSIESKLDDETNGRSNNSSAAPTVDDVECLNVVEEQKLVEYYCGQCVELGKFFEFPINVIATAVQFMKRFYLSNSPMTYHPKQIMPSVLFLATKTENNHIYLKDYVSRLSNPKKQVTPDDILAPEFIITQGLRFTFDVRHPHRGLKGGYMELLALANGKAALLPWIKSKTPASLRDEMLTLPSASSSATSGQQPLNTKKKPIAVPLDRRLEIAYGRANEILKSAAILSDAYFLYSPAQIWLAALQLVDEPLAMFYLDTKIPPPPPPQSSSSASATADAVDAADAADAETKPQTQTHKEKEKEKIIATLRSCAKLLLLQSSSAASNDGSTADLGSAAATTTTTTTNESQQQQRRRHDREELIRIDKKLYGCRIPEKIDLVGINRAHKRDGIESDGKLDGGVAKKRKLERERLERDGGDLFGPAL